MDFSIERNIALASLDSIHRGGLIPRGAERRFAKDWAIRLQLKYGKLTNPAWTLSGGNQQKAVLAKWLARDPTLLIVDEPTRGIDVGTKAEVHRLLSELASRGVAVLMISSELPEVLGMADRIVVLFEGRVARVRAGRGRRAGDHARGHRHGRGGRVTTIAEEQKARQPAPSSHAVAEMLLRFRELGIVLALVLVVGATTIDNPHFLSATSVQQMLSGAAIIALLAIGETIVIITRNVDLSIGSVLGISAYATGALYRAPSACSAWPRLPLRARHRRRVRSRQRRDRHHRARAEPRRHARDALHHPRHRRRVGRRQPGQRLDAAGQLQQDRLRNVPGGSVPRDHRHRRRRDRDLRDARPSARRATSTRSGPIPRPLASPASRRAPGCFSPSSSAAASPASPAPSGSRSTARSTRSPGVGYEFQVIAAVVVGGVAIFGGSGTVLGAALGALLLNTINSALVVVNVSSFWSSALAGALLIAAIAFDRLIAMRVAPALRTRRRARG